MDIVDAQIHSNVLGPPETLLQIMDALGISAALIDEFIGVGKEGTLLPAYRLPDGTTRPIGPNGEAACLQYPDRLQYLMRVDPFDSGLEGWVETLSYSPNLKALRAVAVGEKAETAFADGAFDRLFGIALKYSQPVFVACPNNVTQLAPYARRFPNLRLIVDHCGVRFDRPPGTASIDDVLTLADCPNIALKWAHAALFLTTENYPFRGLDPILERVVNAFGPRRVMWASDYTITRHRSNWGESLFHLRQSPALSESDREWILGRTCREWLGWPAPEILPEPRALHLLPARTGQGA